MADCTCALRCGDGLVNQPGEACDGSDDAVCPGLCLSDCSCGTPSRFIALQAVADTYIEAGTEAAWDHGAADHLDVDGKPAGITHLKFDLSAVLAPVAHATLTLYVTNRSVDGGIFYPVSPRQAPLDHANLC